jgi:hypothetical protein
MSVDVDDNKWRKEGLGKSLKMLMKTNRLHVISGDIYENKGVQHRSERWILACLGRVTSPYSRGQFASQSLPEPA